MKDSPSPQLDRLLDRWRAAGLLTAEQAGAIARFESVDTALDTSGDPPRTSMLAELLAYLGAALAIGAAFVLLQDFWSNLTGAARIPPVALGTVTVALAALSLRRHQAGALRRLGTLLEALAVLGVAFTLGLGLNEITSFSGEAVTALACLVGFAAGMPVHWSRPSWPTTLVVGGMLLSTVIPGTMVASDAGDELILGGWMAVIGVGWAVLGWRGLLPPQNAVEVSGLLTGMFGVQLLSFQLFDQSNGIETSPALAIGLLIAGVALAIGLREDRTPPAVIGGLGLTIFAPQLVNEVFGDALGGPLALLVGGVTLIAIAVVLLRQQTS